MPSIATDAAQRLRTAATYSRWYGKRSTVISRKTTFVLTLVAIALAVGCGAAPPAADEPLTVDALVADPVYDVEIVVQGEISMLDELFCPCFELSSGEETVEVWYDLMTDDDGTMWPAARVDHIANGDQVAVRGELKHAGLFRTENVFWAIEVEHVE
jgi:hypothetical protein